MAMSLEKFLAMVLHNVNVYGDFLMMVLHKLCVYAEMFDGSLTQCQCLL